MGFPLQYFKCKKHPEGQWDLSRFFTNQSYMTQCDRRAHRIRSPIQMNAPESIEASALLRSVLALSRFDCSGNLENNLGWVYLHFKSPKKIGITKKHILNWEEAYFYGVRKESPVFLSMHNPLHAVVI